MVRPTLENGFSQSPAYPEKAYAQGGPYIVSERRVFRGEKVPVAEKVVSYFEEHTDIIVKSRREVVYGHKVFLTSGKSNLILDCLVERGNPADSEQYIPMLKRHEG